MNTRTLILPFILIAATSFSDDLSASTVKNGDAQAQAAALLRHAHVTSTTHIAESSASERVIADAHQQAAALLSGQAARKAHSVKTARRGTARRTSDAHAQAAALLQGLR